MNTVNAIMCDGCAIDAGYRHYMCDNKVNNAVDTEPSPPVYSHKLVYTCQTPLFMPTDPANAPKLHALQTSHTPTKSAIPCLSPAGSSIRMTCCK